MGDEKLKIDGIISAKHLRIKDLFSEEDMITVSLVKKDKSEEILLLWLARHGIKTDTTADKFMDMLKDDDVEYFALMPVVKLA